MLVYVVLMQMVQVAVVQIIDMAIMTNAGVTAVTPMCMRMVFVNRAGHLSTSWESTTLL